VVLSLAACGDNGNGPQLDSGPPADKGVDQPGQQDKGPPAEGGAPDMAPDGPKKPARWEVVPGVAPTGIFGTATLLDDGRVLVTGGYKKNPDTKYLADTWLYLPTKRAFVSAGKLKTSRAFHTATLLSDGRVLVVGGRTDNSKDLASTEIFDPTKPMAQAWTAGPALATPRQSHGAVRLANGDVLLVGGYDYNAGYLDSIAIYMAKANTWKLPAAKMSTVRRVPSVIVLPSKKVLIVGGYTYTKDIDTLEIYDPSSGVFKAVTGKLSYPKYRTTLHVLKTGNVLIAGGVGYNNASDEIYDPVANSIKFITHPGGPPEYHAAAQLKDGTVLVCGGDLSTNHDKALIFDPSGGGAWIPQPNMKVGRQKHHAITLKDGSVLVVGGQRATVEAYVNVAELYFP
jgi:hypothetical protein